jgi:hypothetical protein
MIIHTRIESPHLAGNLLGDPSERDLFVYVPPGYEESDRRYPTAYLLHAYGVTAAQEVTPATDGQRWSPPLEDVLDPVFGRMGVPPMIVAIPDGWSRWGVREMGRLARHRQLRAVRAPRRDPLRRRRVSHAADRAQPRRSRILLRSIRLLEPRLAQPRRLRRYGRALGRLVARHDPQGHALQVPRQHLAGSTERSRRGQLLVGDRLRLRRDLLAQSRQPALLCRPTDGLAERRAAPGCLGPLAQLDPVVNVHDRLDNLRKLSGILLDAGSNDDYNLHWGHRLLSHYLTQAGIAHEHRENSGNHGGRHRERYQMALEWLPQVLDRDAI